LLQEGVHDKHTAKLFLESFQGNFMRPHHSSFPSSKHLRFSGNRSNKRGFVMRMTTDGNEDANATSIEVKKRKHILRILLKCSTASKVLS